MKEKCLRCHKLINEGLYCHACREDPCEPIDDKSPPLEYKEPRMRMCRVDEIEEELRFAQRAAECFTDPDKCTYTDGAIEPGCLLAVRWGLGDDCVIVFKLDDDRPVTNYTQIIKKG